MNIYMGFSRAGGPEEGAMLIFARTAKEARKVGYRYWWDYEYIDFGVRRLRNCDWLYEEADQAKLEKGEPHATDNPRSCCECGHWGQSRIDSDGLCVDCRAAVDEELAREQLA